MSDGFDIADRQAAENIFNAALELTDGERPGYVAEACGGRVLVRERVEALLRAHDAATRFLPEAPVGTTAPPKDPSLASSSTLRVLPAEQTGDRIRRYKLLEKIGEGGCG